MAEPKSMGDDDQHTVDEFVIEQARKILAKRVKRGSKITGSGDAEKLAMLELNSLTQEIFAVLFLDTRRSVISFEKVFFGTIDRSHVHLRVIAKKALDFNASAIIVMHNHPSGEMNPSNTDIQLTRDLADGLKIFDVQVLDHIVVGGGQTYSFASHGLIQQD
jgi:DNA repair protein RadC